jgi:hypothetical protein
MGIGDDFMEGLTNVKNLIGENQAAAIGIAAGSAAVLGLGTAALLSAGSKKRKAKSKRGRKRDRIFKSKQKHEQKYKRKKKYKIYGKKGFINPKSKSKKRSGKVYYARKTGQPYILLKSGKAKFIKGKRRKK